jgi:hypothetical protein
VRPYIVKTGEFLLGIAHRQRFDADAIWNDPKNSDLKDLRGDGSILCSGDVLYIPDPPKPNWMPLAVGASNSFTATVKTAETTVRFAFNGKPCASEGYRVVCAGTDDQKGTSDSDGNVKFKAPLTASSATVYFDDRKLHFTVNLGHLDPADTRSGQLQRLTHLGYLREAAVQGASQAQLDELLTRAISAFQSKTKLPVTGEIDDATRSALVKAHGS